MNHKYISNHLGSFGSFLGIFQVCTYFYFENLKQQNIARLAFILPLENGDPYLFGQTFKYDIFIQDKNSPKG